MYHTFYFFSRLSYQLNTVLSQARLLECFSQQKDELVLRFYTREEKDFYIKADLSQGISMLTFPAEFARTRTNSTDLFSELYGSPVLKIIQSENDRSFHFHFANKLQLCFKMYGGRSNILLHNGAKVLDVFNHHLKKDLDGPIPSGREQNTSVFFHDPDELRKAFPTFNKRIWSHWEKVILHKPDPEKKVLFQNMLDELQRGPMFLCKENNEVYLSFFPESEVLLENQEPILISNRLSQYYWQINQFFKQKEALVLALEQTIFQARMQLESAEKQYLQGVESRNYRLQADLLMAYGHQIPKGVNRVHLPDFSGIAEIEIRLKQDLSVLENAERFYRKAKGQHQDTERLEKRMCLWKDKILHLNDELQKLKSVENRNDLKPFAKAAEIDKEEPESLPYHLHTFLQYEIWVGKNAKSNDELLRISHKDDLWLHARDVTGSHVIIRTKKGKNTPQPVIERAAELAAFYSKSKSESLSPVMVTERKYVRKGKNMLPGQVRVEKEKTILVMPKE